MFQLKWKTEDQSAQLVHGHFSEHFISFFWYIFHLWFLTTSLLSTLHFARMDWNELSHVRAVYVTQIQSCVGLLPVGIKCSHGCILETRALMLLFVLSEAVAYPYLASGRCLCDSIVLSSGCSNILSILPLIPTTMHSGPWPNKYHVIFKPSDFSLRNLI